MSRKAYEEAAKDLFINHLEQERGERWEVLAENYVIDPVTRTDFDYQLSFQNKRIALEIVRLVENDRAWGESATWSQIALEIREELAARGVKDIIVQTPPDFGVPKARRKQFVEEVAGVLESTGGSLNHEVRVLMNGRGYIISPSSGLGEVMLTCSFSLGITSDPCAPLERSLLRILAAKDRQLCVADHERIVLIVGWDETITIEALRKAISMIEIRRLPNIDKVHFETGFERIDLIYDRTAFPPFPRA